jgi:hypothetical protein
MKKRIFFSGMVLFIGISATVFAARGMAVTAVKEVKKTAIRRVAMHRSPVIGEPDGLQVVGPVPNTLQSGSEGDICATVQAGFAGVPGRVVAFTKLMGSLTFNGGDVSQNGLVTTVVTGSDGTAVASFTAGPDAGFALIGVSVLDTELTGFYLFSIVLCGDLDGDSDVDYDDFGIFRAAFGLEAGDQGFVAEADLDGDGIITFVDYQLWLQCYRNNHDAEGTVVVELSSRIATGVSPDTLTRYIRFELSGGEKGDSRFVAMADVVFDIVEGEPTLGSAVLSIPPGYSCITAKDPFHTLGSTVPLELVDEGQYTASFTGDYKLINGDLNDDNKINVDDYDVWYGLQGVDYGTGNTLSTRDPDDYHADISGDGLVTLADYTFIQLNYGMSSPISPCDLQEIEVTVELAPCIFAEMRRCITFELADCNSDQSFTVREMVDFALVPIADGTCQKAVGVVSILVPPADYTCITAKDELHTLRSRGVFISDAVAVFGEEEGNWLLSGDLNNDDVIDELDGSVWNGLIGTVYDSPDTACMAEGEHADLNGDGAVTLADLGFIQLNYGVTSALRCCTTY